VLVLTAKIVCSIGYSGSPRGTRFYTNLACSRALEAVTQVLQQARTSEAKVMAVDDDPQVLVALRNLLEPWGLKVPLDDPAILGNPGRICTGSPGFGR